jgi:Tubulin-tyrosine ligase family.
MFGLDFILDDDLNLWFIECNASPQLIGTNEEKTIFLTTMLRDLFEIQYAYLRSRMARVQKFMAKFQADAISGKEMDIDAYRKEFSKINSNYLEPNFPISPNNSFTLIMDKNLKGTDAYFGHLAPECIDDTDEE